MLRIGLTGGIASGKSVVASLLRDREYPVLDADALTHELLEPGQAVYDEVVREFGRGILAPGGAVDRKKLGAIVFADPQKRKRLEQIIHPRIWEVSATWFSALDRPDGPEFAVLEATLILEGGSQDRLDRVIVCWCTPLQQIARLRDRGFSPALAQSRIAAQMPIDEKRRLGDDVIDCSRSLEETEHQVVQLIEKLAELAKSKVRHS